MSYVSKKIRNTEYGYSIWEYMKWAADAESLARPLSRRAVLARTVLARPFWRGRFGADRFGAAHAPSSLKGVAKGQGANRLQLQAATKNGRIKVSQTGEAACSPGPHHNP
uniref:Transposase n=1 Tax=Globodera pallida TaxID=36090 RepID=A0A183BRB6_GLOPA